jgi:hypothetical protein
MFLAALGLMSLLVFHLGYGRGLEVVSDVEEVSTVGGPSASIVALFEKLGSLV